METVGNIYGVDGVDGVEGSDVIEGVVVSNQKRFLVDATKLSPMILDIRQKLDEYVVGQDLAKDEIVDALAKNLMIDPNRKTPIATLIMVGPTGVGKTEIVRALYRILFGNDLIDIGQCKIDCNTYTQSHETSDLVGAPVGYVGRDQIPILSDKVLFKAFNKALKEGTLHPILDNYENFSILLLDEVEKASTSFHDIFLGIMDEGILELKNGADDVKIGSSEKNTSGNKNVIDYHKTTNFRNVLIIMTSNIGATDIQDKLKGKGQVGFMKDENTIDNILSVEYYTSMVKSSDVFKPEFVARITSLIPFKPLTEPEFFKRLDLSIEKHNNLFDDKGIKLSLTGRAKKYLVETSIATNEGGRSLIKMFEHDIYTKFVRVYNNGEIDRIEETSGHTVKIIEIDYKDDNYIVELLINESEKALNKEKKRRLILEERKKNLDQQEAIVSLKEGSFLITLRDVLLPNLKYYRSLLKKKDKLDKNLEFELVNTKNILDMFGLQDKDFDLLKNEVIDYELVFEKLHLESSGIISCNEDGLEENFSGMLNYVNKYIIKYCEENKSTIVSNKLDTIIRTIVEYVESLLSRNINDSEKVLIISMFHSEYIKVIGSKQIPYKKKEEEKPEVNKPEVNKHEEEKRYGNIIVNININSSSGEQSHEERLSNLFSNDFDVIIKLIKENIENNSDIIEVLLKVKDSYKKDLSTEQGASLYHSISELLKDKKGE
jgi:ATP-dependent protease Clp ATPase subunit